jgi:hypothetical protein
MVGLIVLDRDSTPVDGDRLLVRTVKSFPVLVCVNAPHRERRPADVVSARECLTSTHWAVSTF